MPATPGPALVTLAQQGAQVALSGVAEHMVNPVPQEDDEQVTDVAVFRSRFAGLIETAAKVRTPGQADRRVRPVIAAFAQLLIARPLRGLGEGQYAAAFGIPADAMELLDIAVEIPMIGTGASLNVVVAGSLVLYRLAGFL